MDFGLYSELQNWPGKTPAQVYGEALEQVAHGERCGFATYSLIEHFCFPEFSVSANPLAFFAAASQRTEAIRFRTLLHNLPAHNPVVLASQIAALDILTGGRYEFGIGRGHGWLPPKIGVPLAESRPRYDEATELLLAALENERFSHQGDFWSVDDSHLAPLPPRRFRIFVGGTSDSTYVRAGERGWAIAVPPLLSYEMLRAPLDLYREACAAAGHEPDIVWIHACHLDEDAELARRDAARAIGRFMQAQIVAMPEAAPAEELVAAGYGFYAAGVLESVAAKPYQELIDEDMVWVGSPDEIAERIQAVVDVCAGLTEVAITSNMGGMEHEGALKTQQLFCERIMPRFGVTASAAAGDHPASSSVEGSTP
ncbi:MAG: LLM class flavin-dependent oxidoreductase [Actinobacteria bacterium]|nr:LLM class flavin-dependent oxidoreductase [Actinomycetota bacterium]